jgi:hypothetical protein
MRLVTASLVLTLVGTACPIVPPSPFNQPAPPPVVVPPAVVCPEPIERADTSTATRVGDGTAQSCTEEAFDDALAVHNGGILFNCGNDDVVIALTSSKLITEDLVIDGGSDGNITLDGQNAVRILDIASSFDDDDPRVTVQRLTFTRGASSGNAPEDGGAAIRRIGGTLDVIDCAFVDNHANVDGQDTQGGAIFSLGGGATTVVDTSFTNNSCSNGGALGTLGGDLIVVNASFDDNEATGNGGNPGNGGNGGSIYVDGEGRAVTLCGVTMRGSKANAFGGGMFRVAYAFTEPTDIDRSVVSGAIEDVEPSMGGGLYLQGTVVTMSNTTILDSTAVHAGGAYLGPGSTVNMSNVSFLDNTASSSLGGGLFLDGTLGGDIVNATFAGNRAPGELAFGGAIVGTGAGVSLRNSLILDSVAGNGFNPISCTTVLDDGSGSIQFPVVRAGGDSDDPSALCASGITVADVGLKDRDEDGLVPFRAPVEGSAAIGIGSDCPNRDALGRLRPAACTAGAIELDVPNP